MRLKTTTENLDTLAARSLEVLGVLVDELTDHIDSLEGDGYEVPIGVTSISVADMRRIIIQRDCDLVICKGSLHHIKEARAAIVLLVQKEKCG